MGKKLEKAKKDSYFWHSFGYRRPPQKPSTHSRAHNKPRQIDGKGNRIDLALWLLWIQKAAHASRPCYAKAGTYDNRTVTLVKGRPPIDCCPIPYPNRWAICSH